MHIILNELSDNEWIVATCLEKSFTHLRFSMSLLEVLRPSPPQKRISGQVWSICMKFSAYVGTVVRRLWSNFQPCTL